jgi:hypothetical protein
MPPLLAHRRGLAGPLALRWLWRGRFLCPWLAWGCLDLDTKQVISGDTKLLCERHEMINVDGPELPLLQIADGRGTGAHGIRQRFLREPLAAPEQMDLFTKSFHGRKTHTYLLAQKHTAR